jgi:protein gp37
MADKTAIEWTDATWNPIRALITAADGSQRTGWHCEHASEGCRHCYAETMNARLGTQRPFKPSEIDTGAVHLFLDEKLLLQPLHWKRPRKIFLGSMTDIFARFVPDAWIDRIFAIIAACSQHIFQVLTKRHQRMLNYFIDPCFPARAARWTVDASEFVDINFPVTDIIQIHKFGLPNVWLGVSVENQATADARIPLLLQTPAAKRFISAEPLLGLIELNHLVHDISDSGDFWSSLSGRRRLDRLSPSGKSIDCNKLDWVIAGGESGPNARPMHPNWVRALREQCHSAGVPFFFKQCGEWTCVDQAKKSGQNPSVLYSNPALQFGNGIYHVFDEQSHHGLHTMPGVCLMKRVGKHRAGALLDGIAHKAFPA